MNPAQDELQKSGNITVTTRKHYLVRPSVFRFPGWFLSVVHGGIPICIRIYIKLDSVMTESCWLTGDSGDPKAPSTPSFNGWCDFLYRNFLFMYPFVTGDRTRTMSV